MEAPNNMLTLGTTLYALAMLALVVGMILGLGYILRTYGARLGLGGGAAKEPTLQVVQRLPLTAQHTLIEVRGPTTRYVLVLGPNHTTVVETIKTPQRKAAV